MTRLAVADASTLSWNTVPLPSGVFLQHQTYFQGEEEPPRASCAWFPPDSRTEAHFHLGAEFQLIVEGSVEFPDHTLVAPAVHYVDHCAPYGPFESPQGNKMLILGPRQAQRALIYINNEETKVEMQRLVNRQGRSLLRSGGEVEWEPLPGYEGARRKLLFGERDGPAAKFIELPAGMEYSAEPSVHGQFQVLLEGSFEAMGRQLGPRSLRFIKGDEPAAPLHAGPDGATVVILTFDGDAEWDMPD